MQPVTPRTTRGMARPSALLGLRRVLVLDLPGDGLGEDLLHRDPGRLPAPGLHPRLRPLLDLLGPLGGHGDEPELAVHVPRQDQMRHLVIRSLHSNVPSIARAVTSTRDVRQRAARMIDFSSSTQRSTSSLTIVYSYSVYRPTS